MGVEQGPEQHHNEEFDYSQEVRRTVGEWQPITQTWTVLSKETVMVIRSSNTEERKRREQGILADIQFMEELERDRTPQEEEEDTVASEQTAKDWEELFAMNDVDIAAFSADIPEIFAEELEIEDRDKWLLMLCRLPDEAIDRIIQSFPEFENTAPSLIQRVVEEVNQRYRRLLGGDVSRPYEQN